MSCNSVFEKPVLHISADVRKFYEEVLASPSIISEVFKSILKCKNSPNFGFTPSFIEKSYFRTAVANRLEKEKTNSTYLLDFETFSNIEKKWSQSKKLSLQEYDFLIELLPKTGYVQTYQDRKLFDITRAESAQTPLSERRSLINPHLITNSHKASLNGMTVHHGTSSVYRESVLAGPKNFSMGNATGGSGLYLAIHGDFDYAKVHADSTTRKIGGHTLVLSGKVNSAKTFRVLRIAIDNTNPDIYAGVFPYTWSQNKELSDYVLNNFDLVEVYMSSPLSVNGRF